MKALLRRHPGTTIIWAHTGVGRVIRPIHHHTKMIEDILNDPEMRHVMFDISWDEVAKYVVETPASLKTFADVVNRYPDRFLFGTDAVAPRNPQDYLKTYRTYEPLWNRLTKEAGTKTRKGNYERVFDEEPLRSRSRLWFYPSHDKENHAKQIRLLPAVCSASFSRRGSRSCSAGGSNHTTGRAGASARSLRFRDDRFRLRPPRE
jgi:hypothetical protein